MSLARKIARLFDTIPKSSNQEQFDNAREVAQALSDESIKEKYHSIQEESDPDMPMGLKIHHLNMEEALRKEWERRGNDPDKLS